MIGGRGNDLLDNGNRYLFNEGDGNDTIVNSDSGDLIEINANPSSESFKTPSSDTSFI